MSKKNKKLRNKLFYKNIPTDYTLLFMAFILTAIGIVMIYSSSFQEIKSNSILLPYVKQSIFALAGFVMMIIISKLRLNVIVLLDRIAYILIIGALLLVPIIGTSHGGAKRWLEFGAISIQPSEFAKIILIIFIADFMTSKHKYLGRFKMILHIILRIIIPFTLIALEDLSSSVVLFVIIGVMIFVAYKKVSHVIIIALCGTGLIGIFISVFSYRVGRLLLWKNGPWIDPDGAGRQLIQSLYAIGSGGLTGTGLGNSIQKMGYISMAHNDIIFAIICEELGLIGGFAIILLFVFLLIRIYQIICKNTSMNYFMIGVGVITHIAIQIIINIGVATGTIPNTGIPLPFISYGGSSLIVFLAEIGLVLNIAINNVYEEIRSAR